MSCVSIIGSGNLGANTAFFIAEKGITDVLLYDIRMGLATGKALDMMEAAPVRTYRNRLKGIESLEAIEGSAIVVLAAGTVRTPGMKRDDLLKANRTVVMELAPTIARLAPDSKVIIATEPVDFMTGLFVRESKMPRNQVMGVGGFLDSTRLQYLIARELSVSMENVSALVIGRHADAMIGLPAYTRVSGIPVSQLLPAERIQGLLEETRQAGDLIVDLSQRSSAYYAPSAAAAELVDSIHMDLRRLISVSVVLDGEYGLRDVALSLPSIIGKDGIEKVLTPMLTSDELARLKRSAEQVQDVNPGAQS